MAFSDERLDTIFQRDEGLCAYCDKELSFSNYGVRGARGAWQVDHRNPQARGGSDRLDNLSAACVDCNHKKGTMSARRFYNQPEIAAQRARRSQRKSDAMWEGAVEAIGYTVVGVAAVGLAGAVLKAIFTPRNLLSRLAVPSFSLCLLGR